MKNDNITQVIILNHTKPSHNHLATAIENRLGPLCNHIGASYLIKGLIIVLDINNPEISVLISKLQHVFFRISDQL